MKMAIRISLMLSVAFLFSVSAHAAQGGWFLGGNLGIINADQKDMNDLIDAANTREGGISTSDLGNAWEINGFLGYNMSGSSLGWQIRPSFFYQVQDGDNGSGQDFNYSVTGFTIFPILRWTMLSDQTIKFFSQFGVGWAFLDGSIEEGGAKVEFSGTNMGFQAGLGAEFCFLRGAHCLNIEGNLRFLSVDRVEADKASGTFAGTSLSQAQKGEEVEFNNKDLGMTLSGIQGLVGYTFHF